MSCGGCEARRQAIKAAIADRSVKTAVRTAEFVVSSMMTDATKAVLKSLARRKMR